MERALEQAVSRARIVYEQVTGHPAPEPSVDDPYARIPPEVDREEHVLRQAARLYSLVAGLKFPASSSSDAAASVAPDAREAALSDRSPSIFRDGDELRFVFDLGSAKPEDVSVELRGATLRILFQPSVGIERPEGRTMASDSSKITFERVVFLPVRVEPSRISARLSDGILTLRVHVPAIEDSPQRIEIR